MRRILLVALLLIAPVAAYWGLKTPAVDQYLARRLPEWARARGIELGLESLDFDPWGPSLRVTGLRLGAVGRGWQGSARAVRFRLLAWKLITGVPHLEVEAEAPVFSGEIAGDADGDTEVL